MDSTEFDLRAVLGVIRRQIRLIILVVVGVMALSSVVILSLKPEYTAAALVLVDTRQKNLLDPTAEAYGNSDSARVDSEVELAKAETVLLRAVRDGQLLETRIFCPSPG